MSDIKSKPDENGVPEKMCADCDYWNTTDRVCDHDTPGEESGYICYPKMVQIVAAARSVVDGRSYCTMPVLSKRLDSLQKAVTP